MKWGSWAQSWLWGLVGLALLLLAYRWYQQIQLLQKFNRAQLQGYSSGKNLVKIGLWCLALLALGLAALAPQRVGPGLMAEQRSRDVIIALDVSRSMLVSDLTPNRLTLAKQKIKHLIKLLNAERVGLILFSRTAFVQCPLTRDRAALELFLADVDAESLSAGGTNFSAGFGGGAPGGFSAPFGRFYRGSGFPRRRPGASFRAAGAPNGASVRPAR